MQYNKTFGRVESDYKQNPFHRNFPEVRLVAALVKFKAYDVAISLIETISQYHTLALSGEISDEAQRSKINALCWRYEEQIEINCTEHRPAKSPEIDVPEI